MEENKKSQNEAIGEDNLKDVGGGFSSTLIKCDECGEIAFSPGLISLGKCTECGYDPSYSKCPRCERWTLFMSRVRPEYGSCKECGYNTTMSSI